MSGWIGSALEYYDFALYSLAATLVFPAIFFPSENPTVAIIASLSTYAVGYVSRPIGAVVLGAYGDRHGRKQVLVFAMLLMGFATFAVGLLPTYGQVGSILATAVLLPLAALLPADQFQSWGWRIPLLLSAFVILAGYIIRRRVQEPPA